jgi:hypothetical protein
MNPTPTIDRALGDGMYHALDGLAALSDAELADVTGGSFLDGIVKVAEGVATGLGVVTAIALAPATAPAAVLLGIGVVGGVGAGIITGGGLVEMFPEDELPGPGFDVGPYQEIR